MVARARGFRRRNAPNHGLFTHLRHRIGEEAYQRVITALTRRLIALAYTKSVANNTP